MDDLSCGNSLSFQPSGMLGLSLNVLPMVFGTLQSLQTTREAKAAESKSNCDPWGVGKPLAATTVPIEQIWTGCTMVTAHPRMFRKWKFRFQCTVSFTFPCLLSSNSDPLRAANPYFIRMWRRRLCLPGTPSVSTATTSILPPLVSSIQTANWGEGTSVILQGFVSEEGKSKSPSFWHKASHWLSCTWSVMSGGSAVLSYTSHLKMQKKWQIVQGFEWTSVPFREQTDFGIYTVFWQYT